MIFLKATFCSSLRDSSLTIPIKGPQRDHHGPSRRDRHIATERAEHLERTHRKTTTLSGSSLQLERYLCGSRFNGLKKLLRTPSERQRDNATDAPRAAKVLGRLNPPLRRHGLSLLAAPPPQPASLSAATAPLPKSRRASARPCPAPSSWHSPLPPPPPTPAPHPSPSYSYQFTL